jgi:competence protein ComFC
MKILTTLRDIFVDDISTQIPNFLPKELTGHYKKELGHISIDSIYIATTYSEIEQSISQYKYESDRENVDLFVDLLSKVWEKYGVFREENATIVPVPMHWSRYFSRWFDHTRLLVVWLAKRFGISHRKLLSARWAKRQSHLSREKRLENKKNSFKIRSHNALPSTVILIDDVISTGSTANECARILKEAGVKRVIWIFLAANH